MIPNISSQFNGERGRQKKNSYEPQQLSIVNLTITTPTIAYQTHMARHIEGCGKGWIFKKIDLIPTISIIRFLV
jgi:hypothetical protein